MRYKDIKKRIGNIKDDIVSEVTHFLNTRDEYELQLNFNSGNRKYENAYLEDDTLYVGGFETEDGITIEFSEKALEMPFVDAAFMLKIIESKQINN